VLPAQHDVVDEIGLVGERDDNAIFFLAAHGGHGAVDERVVILAQHRERFDGLVKGDALHGVVPAHAKVKLASVDDRDLVDAVLLEVARNVFAKVALLARRLHEDSHEGVKIACVKPRENACCLSEGGLAVATMNLPEDAVANVR
jgi:hypothetical protein